MSDNMKCYKVWSVSQAKWKKTSSGKDTWNTAGLARGAIKTSHIGGYRYYGEPYVDTGDLEIVEFELVRVGTVPLKKEK